MLWELSRKRWREAEALTHERETGVYYLTGFWGLWWRRNYNETAETDPTSGPQILSKEEWGFNLTGKPSIVDQLVI